MDNPFIGKITADGVHLPELDMNSVPARRDPASYSYWQFIKTDASGTYFIVVPHGIPLDQVKEFAAHQLGKMTAKKGKVKTDGD